jgi:hypothetical protein
MPKQRARRRVTPAAEPAAIPAPGNPDVSLRMPSGAAYNIPGGMLPAFSMYWSYVVRNRQRWAGESGALSALTQRATEKLQQLGITVDNLKALAESGIVEVRIPFLTEAEGWAARILPWEYLLSAATLPYRNTGLVVVRHLDNQSSPPPAASLDPERLLFVLSAAGPFSDFTFESERRLVEAHLGLTTEVLPNPTVQQLTTKIASFNPSVIHLSGIDWHQGARLLKLKEGPDDARRDGFYLSASGGVPERVEAWDLSGALNPPGVCPFLVSFNFYNSAARVAALAVARGARAAIGFQDEIDDAMAELFFANFYECWRENNWSLRAAFEQVWETMGSAAGKLRGSGIVLWSAESLLLQPKPAATPEDIKSRRETKNVPLKGTGDGGADGLLIVDVEPHRTINYSLLHNRNGLFERFTISRLKPGWAKGIQVEVILYVGAESFPFRATVSLGADDSVLDVAPKINVPLTSRFARSIRDTVQSSLYVEVSYLKEELHRNTYRVALAPVDEWTLNPDDQSGCLASFVLSRDPAVARVIDTAQKYLMALRDDPGAGFDGYQSMNQEGQDMDERCEPVDMQVRALWAALSFDLPLSYINPPPNFTVSAQRLRTPSDVIGGHRGTCIDLALLFAACLEFVDIYPVVFLLTDHAFPGYWRSEESYQKYLGMTVAAPAKLVDGVSSASSETQRLCGYEEVNQLIQSGDLVPLETVWLTRRQSFSDAIDAGAENLGTPSEFAALLDIKAARASGVTPLPITGEPL